MRVAKKTDFNKASVLILGGTGTLGIAILEYLTDHFPGCKITILSRDEQKQAIMRRAYPGVTFVIGDIRCRASIARHFAGKNVVFHVAAMKHVDVCEENPMECIKTNELGTMNAADCAIAARVPNFVFSSTDKAIDPINQYGRSKAAAECLLYGLNRSQQRTRFSVYRWGNVIGSNGSAVPIFADTLKRERTAYVTDERMTRFWLPIKWATQFMLTTFSEAYTDKAMVLPAMKAAPVVDVVKCIADILMIDDFKIQKIPIRAGEKIHEAMYSQHECDYTSKSAPQYSYEELRELLKPIVLEAVS